MDDTELNEIRQKKLAELQEQREAAQESAKQEDIAKQQIEQVLHKFLTPDAWEQWNNLKYRDALAQTKYAHQVAMMLIEVVQSGQIQGKINKEQLKRFLTVVQQKTRREINIRGLSEKFRNNEKE